MKRNAPATGGPAERGGANPAAGTKFGGQAATARLAELAARYGLSDQAVTALGHLLDALADPEAPTTVHDPEEAVDVHIADSLAGLEVHELRAAGAIADLGAGAGLPGLALAATLPRARVALVESVRRKCAFISTTAAAARLHNIEVVCARAEEWAEGIDGCDAVCARALAPLPVLCEYAAPLLRLGGVLVAWKGRVEADEEADGLAAAETLGLERLEVRAVSPYPGSRHRTLHVLRKVHPTPGGYPRRPGMAVKRPLRARR